jgi:hypothetical protein
MAQVSSFRVHADASPTAQLAKGLSSVVLAKGLSGFGIAQGLLVFVLAYTTPLALLAYGHLEIVWTDAHAPGRDCGGCDISVYIF